ncbi:sodium/calcium exchanger protein [Niveomyces insectorum RCEF 264]|uniref:Sodium/calcium exchanger protein n=1 Tax=Niveomyces insectorum RCEF 264 TaxID=1081102 RepID=A0A167U5R5_9HYPO|nr:sodium/calcium exchanger protein [Niveomyces insectorum RCEF 264]
MPLPAIRRPYGRPRRRAKFRSRPFFVSIAVLLSLVLLHRFVPGGGLRSGHAQDSSGLLVRRLVFQPGDDDDDNVPCRLVHQAADQCAFVRQHCQDEAAGLLPYLTFYYCTLHGAHAVAFAVLVVWLGLLFTTIGIAASDFFSVNLGTIASILGLSESLAGVTFLAFGNGSPDVFSTFAAMNSNSGSMAVGELIGAAGFITGVVAGSMALVREFRVSRRTFVRDICFFIVAVLFSVVFLADGRLMLWECCAMIGFYVFYVLTVVGWHWVSSRRSRRRAREAVSRGHFYDYRTVLDHAGDGVGVGGGSGGGGAAVDNGEEDEVDDSAPLGGRRRPRVPDISALERGPRIQIQSVESPELQEFDVAAAGGASTPISPHDHTRNEEQQERHNRHISAEMSSSMRVSRPRGRRTTATIAPIRPSLLGALEFRSVLASLQKSGMMHLAPLDRRRLAAGRHRPSFSRGYSVSSFYEAGDGWHDGSGISPQSPYHDGAFSAGHTPGERQQQLLAAGRDRASSMPFDTTVNPFEAAASAALRRGGGGADRGAGGGASDGDLLGPAPADSTGASSFAVSPKTKGGTSPAGDEDHLAASTQPATHATQLRSARSPSGLHLDIPSSPEYGTSQPQQGRHSPRSLSPALSPFPGYTETPQTFTPLSPSSRASSLLLPTAPSRRRRDEEISSFSAMDDESRLALPKPVRWWPYRVLPAPHVITRTLFPSLFGWHEKTVWDKFVSVISVPTVFLLVMTLPVVETEVNDDDDDDDDEGDDNDNDLDEDAGDDGRDDVGDAVRVPLLNGSGVLDDTDDETDAGDPVRRGESEWHRYRRSMDASRGLPSPVIRAMRHAKAHAASASASASSSSSTAAPAHVPAAFTAVGDGAAAGGDDPSNADGPHLQPPTGAGRPVAWISTVAGEVVGVLKAFGVIVGMSEAILGLTIFAVGNSLGDLVADITVARLGYPVMALSACFGGPMLNILLGVGIGGAWMAVKAAKARERAHPGEPRVYEPYAIEVGGTLLVSAVTVLVTLVVLLVAVPAHKWRLTRTIGLALIGLWTVSTVLNVVLELTGAWA